MPARRALALALPWLLVLSVARVVVAPAEGCPRVTAGEVRSAATEAVGWFSRNQRVDGRWVYGYERDTDGVDLRPHVVRHSGVILSLYQAHAAHVEGALAVADRGVEWSLHQAVRHDGWLAIRGGDEVRTGGTALLLAGLAERRRATGDARFDDEMTAMGRFLVAQTEPSGAVLATWNVSERRAEPGVHSPYFTGEAYLALALLSEVDGDGPWEPTAERIGRYLATERDDAEDRFPPTSDHWAAYGLAQMRRPPADRLDPDERAFAIRQAGLFGIQVRYESQRTDEGLNATALRGPRTSGSGLATLGEGLGSLWRLDPRALGEREHAAIGERLRCVAGMLVDRQVDEAEAELVARPGLARGAWFASGATRMDDQQHALSALLLAEPALAEPATRGGSSNDDDLGRSVWLALVAGAVATPGRLRRLLPGTPARALAPGVAATTVVLAAVALGAGWLLRGLSVSPATALVAAGLMVALGAAADLISGRRADAPGTGGLGSGPAGLTPGAAELTPGAAELTPGAAELTPGPAGLTSAAAGAVLTLRPVLALLVLAIAGDIGAGPATAAALVAGAAALVRLPDDRWLRTTAQLTAVAVALLGAIDLIADGILSV